jgi:hypothetical protein
VTHDELAAAGLNPEAWAGVGKLKPLPHHLDAALARAHTIAELQQMLKALRDTPMAGGEELIEARIAELEEEIAALEEPS